MSSVTIFNSRRPEETARRVGLRNNPENALYSGPLPILLAFLSRISSADRFSAHPCRSSILYAYKEGKAGLGRKVRMEEFRHRLFHICNFLSHAVSH